MKLQEGVSVAIEHAVRVGDYTLRLRFSDGTENTINFEPFLQRSTNPLIRAFLEPEKFSSFRLLEGDLTWGDYELCFPIADLYEGSI